MISTSGQEPVQRHPAVAGGTRPGRPGSIADPRLRPLLVGTHPVLTIAVKKGVAEAGVTAHFPTLEPALDHARAPYAGLLA